MTTELWKSTNYTTNARYYINTYIREYDLSKANITSLLYSGKISKDEFDYYLNIPKQQREREIGLRIREDNTFYSSIKNGILEAKRRLVINNNIEDLDVVSVKNDAMFIAGKNLSYLEFPPFIFKMANEYTMFMRLQNLEIYYGDTIDINTGNIDINFDIKGMSDQSIGYHSGGMLDIILDACYKLQRSDIIDTMQWICQIYDKYINRQLPIIYYRNFDSESMYSVNTYIRRVSVSELDESAKDYINIDRNLSILRDLYSIISDVYRNIIR